MTNDDVLYAYRLRVLASARELGSVAAACRLPGAQAHGSAARAGALSEAPQLRPGAQRAPDQRPDAR
jgi:hypothetical protein